MLKLTSINSSSHARKLDTLWLVRTPLITECAGRYCEIGMARIKQLSFSTGVCLTHRLRRGQDPGLNAPKTARIVSTGQILLPATDKRRKINRFHSRISVDARHDGQRSRDTVKSASDAPHH